MGGFFSPDMPSAPPPPPMTQQPVGAQAVKSQTNKANAAAGASSTIMTGADGLTTPATTSNKTLLGG